MRRPAEETRAHVLEVAARLFYWDGIRATGIDRVAAEAGVAPTTLYRLFPSKDALVTAYVDRGDLAFRAAFEAGVAFGRDPRGAILGAFAALADVLRPDRCRGCSSQMALAEYPDAGSGPRLRATEAKAWVLDRFDALAAAFCAERAPGGDAARLARQLLIVYEGLVASALSGPADRLLGAGVALVGMLLDSVERGDAEGGATASEGVA